MDVAPILSGFDEATVFQASQVAAGIAGAESCLRSYLTRGLLTIEEGIKDRQAGRIGQTVEEAGTDQGIGASRLRHGTNDSRVCLKMRMMRSPMGRQWQTRRRTRSRDRALT